MDGIENRQIARDSLFLLADLKIEGASDEARIKVRNLSAGGMMGEGPVRVSRGAQVSINLRNIGWVDGSVAWVQDDRFGVAFHNDIDPKVARATANDGEHTPRYVKPPLSAGADPKTLRKV